MKKIYLYITLLSVIFLNLSLVGCKDDELLSRPHGEGVPLTFGEVSFDYESNQPNTRLAELNPDSINGNSVDQFKHIGVYVFYKSDYNKGDYSKPYVKNLEYKYENNTIVPVQDSGEKIYIYDEMVVVALYPYNDYYNTNPLTDFNLYPRTKSDYSEQKYIPYRATSQIYPSTAYKTHLYFSPMHTIKIEIVVVGSFTAYADLGDEKNIKIAPNVDPVDAEEGDKREKWVDNIVNYDNDGSGRFTRKYSAYIWKNWVDFEGTTHSDNKLQKGDIIFQSDKLTLSAIEDVDFVSGVGYRYGYNIETGEYFVLSSSSIVNCAKRIHGGGFQVCDIDLSKVSWTPKDFTSSFYDGGGHKIYGLTIDQDFSSQPDKIHYTGLFTRTINWTTMVNMCLESPVINVKTSPDATEPTYVGGFLGYAMQSDSLTTLHRRLSIRGCKVNNPIINVTGANIYVGGFAGRYGHTTNRDYLRDSYVLGGSITTNPLPLDSISPDTINASCFVGGMIGANMGNLQNCFTTTSVTSARRDSTWTITVQRDTIEIENEWGGIDEEYIITRDTIVNWFEADLAYGFGTNRQNHCREKAPGVASGCYSRQEVTAEYDTVDSEKNESVIGTTMSESDGSTEWATYSGVWPVIYSKLGGSYWRTNSYQPQNSSFPILAWE